VVVDEEWPLMREGRTSPRAKVLADELRRSVQEFEPTTNREQALYAQELEALTLAPTLASGVVSMPLLLSLILHTYLTTPAPPGCRSLERQR
jgi:hypothetical protein